VRTVEVEVRRRTPIVLPEENAANVVTVGILRQRPGADVEKPDYRAVVIEIHRGERRAGPLHSLHVLQRRAAQDLNGDPDIRLKQYRVSSMPSVEGPLTLFGVR
jgi:hypothetical protein